MKQDLEEPGEFLGLALADVTPELEKWWFQYPHLRKLNFLLLCAFLAQSTCGFDGSMLNGTQSLPLWQEEFNHPDGAKLGALVIAINFGVLASRFISSQMCEMFGRKKPISCGIAMIVIGSALQAGAPNFGTFFAGRFIIGFGTGIVAVASPQLMTECIAAKSFPCT